MILKLLQPIPVKHFHSLNEINNFKLRNGETLKVMVIDMDSASGNIMYLFHYKGMTSEMSHLRPKI